MRPDLQPLDIPAGARAFTTLRSCRCVSEPYDGFSLCTYSGDTQERTEAARKELAIALGITPDRIVSARQTHSCNVATVDSTASPDDTDALVCATSGIAIGIHTADCVPIVLYDPTARVIAAVHSGWRGTVGRIAQSAVKSMCDAGATPEKIHAAMGPCICPECFEVGEEVAYEFERAGMAHAVRRDLGVKPHIDLPEAVRTTLLTAGLKAANIRMPVGCSRCSHNLYFSARRLGTASGRTFTFIMLD